MMLSENFSLEEMTRSEVALRRGIGNAPGPGEVEALRRLCRDLLEAARELLGCPLHVTSGYRSPAVNALVGGSRNSAHMAGLAADVVPVGVPVPVAFGRLVASDLVYDQAILECGSWLHLALAQGEREPRRQALVATGGPGRWTYEPAAGTGRTT